MFLKAEVCLKSSKVSCTANEFTSLPALMSRTQHLEPVHFSLVQNVPILQELLKCLGSSLQLHIVKGYWCALILCCVWLFCLFPIKFCDPHVTGE